VAMVLRTSKSSTMIWDVPQAALWQDPALIDWWHGCAPEKWARCFAWMPRAWPATDAIGITCSSPRRLVCERLWRHVGRHRRLYGHATTVSVITLVWKLVVKFFKWTISSVYYGDDRGQDHVCAHC